jgi:hypothetical protein
MRHTSLAALDALLAAAAAAEPAAADAPPPLAPLAGRVTLRSKVQHASCEPAARPAPLGEVEIVLIRGKTGEALRLEPPGQAGKTIGVDFAGVFADAARAVATFSKVDGATTTVIELWAEPDGRVAGVRVIARAASGKRPACTVVEKLDSDPPKDQRKYIAEDGAKKRVILLDELKIEDVPPSPGEDDRADVEATLARVRPAFQKCYTDFLKAHPDGGGGLVDIGFTVEKDGHFTHVDAHGFDTEVDACLRRAISPLKLDPPPAAAFPYETSLRFNAS